MGALKDLRQEEKDQVLWVDAICIDQKNDTERSAQVALMGRSYSETSHLLIWLGPVSKEDSSDLAMELAGWIEKTHEPEVKESGFTKIGATIELAVKKIRHHGSLDSPQKTM